MPARDQGLPRRHTRARQSGAFLETQMRRNFHYTVLGKSDFLSQDTGNARTSRAEILPGRIGERRAGEPVLKIGAGHAIPDFPTGDAFAEADDFARAIGHWHERRRSIAILPVDDHEVAKIQRHGVNADEHLAGAGHGFADFGELNAADAGDGSNLVGFYIR